jgi:membrane-anchored mycosin MYCP
VRAPFLARTLAASALAMLPALGTPCAQAVSPPKVDDSLLPKPSRPTPPSPTVQREVCATISTDSEPGPSQNVEDLPRIWQLTRGAGQRVAVIDTGVSRHPRLPDVVPGGDYVSTGDGTQDCDAHGTLVAGIIAATTSSDHPGSFSGLAPETTLIAIRQSSAKFAPANDRSHAGIGDVDTLAKAVRTAADLGASVINISSVACGPVASGLDDRALGAALAYAVDVKNVVVVAAAGNSGAAQCPPQRPDATWETITVAVSPAWYDDYVLTVGSVDAQGKPSGFTLAGPWVDVAAPGEDVRSLGSEKVSGTSYAAPVVSGLAALIRARFPSLTARQVMQRIESTAHHPPAGWDPLVGNGTVDLLAAVSTGAGPTPGAAAPTPMPIATAPPSTPAKPHAPDTAVRGAIFCLVALAITLAVGVARVRLRRSRDAVSGD